MKKKFIILFFISFFLGIFIHSFIPKTKIISTHNLIVEKKLPDLIEDSNIIIKGIVNRKLQSRWSNQNFFRGSHISNIIQTDFEISIDEVLKGKPYNDNYIRVRNDVGKIDNVEFISSDIPTFKIDQEVILFLSKDDSDMATNEDYYVLSGMGQGFYEKENKFTTSYTCVYNDENQKTIEEENIRNMIAKILN